MQAVHPVKLVAHPGLLGIIIMVTHVGVAPGRASAEANKDLLPFHTISVLLFPYFLNSSRTLLLD